MHYILMQVFKMIIQKVQDDAQKCFTSKKKYVAEHLLRKGMTPIDNMKFTGKLEKRKSI